MRQAKHITRAAAYADSDDFRRIFNENMNSLHLLAFLLTADHGKAEQCFVSGLKDAVGSSPVFKEWAHSWARRMIIKNAVRIIELQAADASGRLRLASVDNGYTTLSAGPDGKVSAVLGLEPFERLVYVITVLEHYPDHECSLLLGCMRREILPARTRALEQTGRQAQRQTHQLSNLSAQASRLHDGPDPLIESMPIPHLATSA